MQTRSSQTSVLGKRAHHVDLKAVASVSATDVAAMTQQMITPERTPKSKRARMSLSAVDGDSNKENVPPFRVDAWNDTILDMPSSLRSDRTSTEIISPSRTRSGKRGIFSLRLDYPYTVTTSLETFIHFNCRKCTQYPNSALTGLSNLYAPPNSFSFAASNIYSCSRTSPFGQHQSIPYSLPGG